VEPRLLAAISVMPSKTTLERARQDARQGKSASTQAGEFVREEIEHVREGKHGARSPEQAIAIGLSKARRAGVKVKPPASGKTSEKVPARAVTKRPSAKRSRATKEALKREGHEAASKRELSRHARKVAARRS
jgi:hypothetical protein